MINRKLQQIWRAGGVIFTLLLIAGCAFTPGPSTQVPLDIVSTLPAETASAPTPLIAQSLTPTSDGPVALTVWVPPQFDPDSGSAAGQLFKARLEEFTASQPDVEINVRVKAEEGPGGLYDSLETASAAAQQTLPDLIALPQPTFQTAVLKGLLRSMDATAGLLDDPDWYDYARQLGVLQNNVYGLPFAGDALVQVYRDTPETQQTAIWDKVLQLSAPLIFPAGDPQSLFSLALYESNAGDVYDEQGSIFLEEEVLSEVLDFYQKASVAGVLSSDLAAVSTHGQAWDQYKNGQAHSVSTWTSDFLADQSSNDPISGVMVAPLPTPDGKPYTYATGWVWALASPDLEQRQAATELAGFLTESEFMSKWTQASGYLPTRPSALAAWQVPRLRTALENISAVSTLVPPIAVLDTLGPPLQKAVLQVLQSELDPSTAASQAVDSLEKP